MPRNKLGALHWVINKSAYMAIGVDIEAIKHILGLWIAKEEGASFGAQVSSNLSNRGVKNVLIVCCDGLKAYLTRSPGFMVQTCVVHLIRAANRWVAYGDRKKVSAALKKSTPPQMRPVLPRRWRNLQALSWVRNTSGPLKSGRTRGSSSCSFTVSFGSEESHLHDELYRVV